MADTERTRCSKRGSTRAMSVPLPAPEGPEMTISLEMAGLQSLPRACPWRPRGEASRLSSLLALEVLDQLATLPRGETDDRLRGADAAAFKNAGGLHTAEFGDRHDEVEDLGGMEILRRIHQHVRDVHLTVLEALLETSTLRADTVGTLQRFNALLPSALWSLRRCAGGSAHVAVIIAHGAIGRNRPFSDGPPARPPSGTDPAPAGRSGDLRPGVPRGVDRGNRRHPRPRRRPRTRGSR